MKKVLKKVTSVFCMCCMMMFMVFAVPTQSYAATSAKTSSSSYCTVKINQSLINKSGKQYATVKLKTYDMTGWWNTGAKVRVTLRDGNGRYITSWIAKGGDTFKLGDDHRTYRIYVDYYDNPGNNFISQGNNFTNMGASYKWTFSNPKNCTMY